MAARGVGEQAEVTRRARTVAPPPRARATWPPRSGKGPSMGARETGHMTRRVANPVLQCCRQNAPLPLTSHPTSHVCVSLLQSQCPPAPSSRATLHLSQPCTRHRNDVPCGNLLQGLPVAPCGNLFTAHAIEPRAPCGNLFTAHAIEPNPTALPDPTLPCKACDTSRCHPCHSACRLFVPTIPRRSTPSPATTHIGPERQTRYHHHG
eukprot:361894-Chlamydomonas_euryale.AAC.12